MSAADIGTCDWSDLWPKREPGWVMVTPGGNVDGVIGWRAMVSTAEQAHRKFTPRMRDREQELREGWIVRREQPGDREALNADVEEAAE